MPQKITAFNTNITIHQEYYYNPSEVISNPEKSIYTLTRAAFIVTTGFFIINPFGIEIPPEYQFAFTSSVIITSSYICDLIFSPGTIKNNFIQELHNINDAFVVLAEYTRDYLEFSGESEMCDID